MPAPFSFNTSLNQTLLESYSKATRKLLESYSKAILPPPQLPRLLL
jgi:hypothetical protein